MIYLFDKDEQLIKLIRKDVIKTALQKFELKDGYVSDRLTVEMRMLSDDDLQKVEYMAIQSIDDTHDFHYFWVAQKNNTDNITTLVGVQSGIEELQKTVVYDQRPQNQLAKPVIDRLLEGTNWRARFVGGNQTRSTNFYYISTFEALKKVCSVWGLEMQYFVEMNGNSVGARYIDFKHKIGKAVGQRVVYGHNALQILQEVERTNIYTALIGRGKGEETESGGFGRKLTFENVVWTTPVAKPLGRKYVEIPSMTALYGIKNADGTMRPKIGTVEFQDETDPARLLRLTYEHLINVSRPQVTFKTSTAYISDAEIGDTIRVVRHDKHIDYETRIFEITFNRLNDQSADIKLGDNIKGESDKKQIQSAVNSALNSFVDNELNPVIERMPSFLASADGKNRNWYTENDPVVTQKGKVIIGDIWFKPDPEFEGEKIMLRWTGEVWEEILRTSDPDRIKRSIDQQFDDFNESYEAEQARQDEVVKEILDKASAAENLAGQAKSISDQAKLDATSALTSATKAKADAIAEAQRLDTIVRQDTETKLSTAKSQAIEEANKLVETAKSLLNGQISGVSTDLNQTKEAIKLLATRATVDALTGRVSSAESTLQVQAGEIASRVKTSDFDQAKQRISTAESSITQLGNRITTEISETVAKIPQNVGSRNYIKNSKILDYVITAVNTQEVRFWIVDDFWNNTRRFKKNMVRVSFDISFSPALPSDISTNIYFSASPWYNPGGITFKGGTTKPQHFDLLFDLSSATETYRTDNIFIRFGNTFPLSTNVKVEEMTLYLSELKELWTQATEDLLNDISSVRTIITQTAEGQEQLSTKLTETQGKVTNAETNIRQLVNDVSSKVSQTTFDNLKRTVDSQETSISQNQSAILLKADKTYADSIKGTADSALSKANDNAQNISQTQAELEVTNDAVNTKVSQTEFNAVNQRLSTAETTIRTQAGLIEQRLTSTQVESAINAKGYQTKADVDKNITDRGYITNSALQPYVTSTVFENKVRETTDSFSRSITETKALIPTDFGGGNLIRNGAFPTETSPWSGPVEIAYHDFYFQRTKPLFLLKTSSNTKILASTNRFELRRNTDYTLSFRGFLGSNVASVDVRFLARKSTETTSYSTVERVISKQRLSSSKVQYVTATFNSGENDSAFLRFDNNGSTNGELASFFFGEVMLVEGRTARKWEPSYDELITVTKFHEVKDTVDAHTRTIGEQGKSISQVIQTAEGLVSRVDNVQSGISTVQSGISTVQSGISTVQSQLAGSWAVKNLTSAGTVLNQLNLNKDGSVKIDGRLVQITGTTYIQDGVITSAKIASLDAAKITAGTLDAGKVNVINLNASKIVGLDAMVETLFAKDVFATQVQSVSLSADKITGGLLKSTNNSIVWDLNDANLAFNRNAKVVFNDVSNTISYTKKGTTGLLKFNNADYNAPEATFGVNRNGDLSSSDGMFSGIRVRGFKYKNGSFVDEVYAIGDDIYLTGGYGENNGFRFSTAGDELGFYPRANRQYALGSPNLRFTTLYLDEVNIRASSTKSYNLREALGKLAAACGISL